jgi:hypothetical protein
MKALLLVCTISSILGGLLGYSLGKKDGLTQMARAVLEKHGVATAACKEVLQKVKKRNKELTASDHMDRWDSLAYFLAVDDALVYRWCHENDTTYFKEHLKSKAQSLSSLIELTNPLEDSFSTKSRLKHPLFVDEADGAKLLKSHLVLFPPFPELPLGPKK